MRQRDNYESYFNAYFLLMCLVLSGCKAQADRKDSEAVDRQQKQYVAAQPIPAFDWSLERHLVTQLYQICNTRAATHSVWRSGYGMIEGACASIGFGIPYDTSLTNPLQYAFNGNGAVIEQAEPNRLFG